jgi:glycosyltransferase involved in cell wall biosynthesis
MNILVAADVLPNPDSGAAGTVYQTVQALRALGHDVDCVWADQMPHRIQHGNSHYLLELPAAYRSVIRERCARKPYDAIHVSQPHCWLAARDHQRSHRRGVFVQRSHGWELRANEVLDGWRYRWGLREKHFPLTIPSWMLGRLLDRHNRLAARWCDGTTVLCENCRAYIVSRQFVEPERVAAIAPAPIDEMCFSAPERRGDERQRVLYVGQFAFFKAPAVIADTMRRLGVRFPQASFTWVCEAKSHDAVRILLGELAPRVTLHDWMPQAKLRDVYDRHGVLLFPSLFEGFGKVFLEAMARGLCVAASDVGGMSDVIRTNDNGWLVPAGDAPALAAAAEKMMSEPALFARISRAARETALRYTWQRAARETVGFYERLLKLKQARRP